MRSWLMLILLLAGSLQLLPSRGSDLAFENISQNQGLSQSIVKSILQDRFGRMVFATEDGVNIYDGYSFTILRNNPADPDSLSYNDITALCEDRHGNLWIGTFNSGINLFLP